MGIQNEPDYDFEDLGFSAEQLIAKYPSGHTTYTIEMWKKIADTDTTQNGYWDWVVTQIAKDDEEF